MNTSWKAIWLAAAGTMCAAVPADAQENPSTGDRTLTVLVSDYAGLPDSSKIELETLGAALLSRAGIRTQWVHCGGQQQGPRPALCDANLETGMVLIRILDAKPGNQKRPVDPLGAAVVENGYASLYVSEIRKHGDRKSTRLNSSHLGISYAV